MARYTPATSPMILTDLQVDGTTLGVDETNDLVGIGTDEPEAKLEIVNQTAEQIALSVLSTVATTDDAAQVAIANIAAGNENPLLLLENSSDDVNGAGLSFLKNSDVPEDNDYITSILFQGKTDAGEEGDFARIDVQQTDVSNAAKNGSIVFSALVGNDETEVARINPESPTADTFMGGFGTKVPVAAGANGVTLSPSQSGGIFQISTNGGTITLPATVKGVVYTFVWIGTAGNTFNISPNASDKIIGSILDVATGNIVTAASSGAGADNKDLQLDNGSQLGDRVTLVGDGADGWYIMDGLGSWVFE